MKPKPTNPNSATSAPSRHTARVFGFRVSGFGFLLCLLVLCRGPACAAAMAAETHVDLDDRFGDLRVEHPRGGQSLIVVGNGPDAQRLTPRQFILAIEREQEAMRARGVLFVLFNITTWWGVLWVSVGLMGQLMFTLRMILQWLASEKAQRSVVPVAFWWGSLLGGLMLLVYFVWRKDIVGILGQSTGAIIYTRNLWLIYFGARAGSAKPTPGVTR